MTLCHFDEFEDTVLSVELAAEKFSDVQISPTLWKWVIIAMQNAMQSAMVLALTGADGCGALKPKSQKQNREWRRRTGRGGTWPTIIRYWLGSRELNCWKVLSRHSPKVTVKTSNGLISCGDDLPITIRQPGESNCSTC